MSLVVIIAFGMAAAAAAMTLARLEARLSISGAKDAPRRGGATGIIAWIAFGALALSSLISLGIPMTVILVASTMIMGRLTPAHPAFAGLFSFKLPIAVAAMLAAVAALFGTLTLIQGVSL